MPAAANPLSTLQAPAGAATDSSKQVDSAVEMRDAKAPCLLSTLEDGQDLR